MPRWKISLSWKQFFDIFTVFLGVMLAFMVNSWKEEWHNRQLRQQYWANFYQEIRANQQEMDSVLTINQKRLARMAQWVNALQNAQSISQDSLPAMLNLITRMNMVQLRTATYEAAKNSGIWHLFTNERRMIQLVHYYQKIQELRLLQDIYLKFFNQQTIPYLQKHVDFLTLAVRRNLLKEVEFRNIFVVHYSLLGQLVSAYRELYQLGSQIVGDKTPMVDS